MTPYSPAPHLKANLTRSLALHLAAVTALAVYISTAPREVPALKGGSHTLFIDTSGIPAGVPAAEAALEAPSEAAKAPEPEIQQAATTAEPETPTAETTKPLAIPPPPAAVAKAARTAKPKIQKIARELPSEVKNAKPAVIEDSIALTQAEPEAAAEDVTPEASPEKTAMQEQAMDSEEAEEGPAENFAAAGAQTAPEALPGNPPQTSTAAAVVTKQAPPLQTQPKTAAQGATQARPLAVQPIGQGGAGTLGHGGGIGHGGNSLQATDMGLYMARMVAKIRAALQYPAALREKGITGIVELRLNLLPTGQVSRIELMKSSGHADLDRLAVEAVQRAQPFDPLTQGVQVRVPVDFRLLQRKGY